MKIAILGAGALGCAIGATLTEGGHETWLLHRSAAHVEAMRHESLQVDDANGSRRVMVRATVRAAEVGAADLIVVLVKSFHTEAAMRGALELVGPDTLVLSLQNGLGHEDVLAAIVGRKRVLAGKTYVGGVLRGLGHIQSGVAGKATYIGELDGRLTPRVQGIADAFSAAGLATKVSDNIPKAYLEHVAHLGKGHPLAHPFLRVSPQHDHARTRRHPRRTPAVLDAGRPAVHPCSTA